MESTAERRTHSTLTLQEIRVGLLDKVDGPPLGKVSYGLRHSLVASALRILSDPGTGGPLGLLDELERRGLGTAASSWVRAGTKIQIQGRQIHDVLGPVRVRQVAENAGVSNVFAASALAQILPRLVGRLAFDGGGLPDAGALHEALERLRRALVVES